MPFLTLQKIKSFNKTEGEEHDAELERLIPIVQGFLEGDLKRPIERATVTEYYSPKCGADRLLLKRPPIASITSIHDDPERAYGASTLLSSSDYVIEDADAGIITLPRRTFSGGVASVKIVYVGGFAEDSLDRLVLEQAAIELLWMAHDKGDKALLGLSSKSIADGSVAGLRNDWPSGVESILNLYRLRT